MDQPDLLDQHDGMIFVPPLMPFTSPNRLPAIPDAPVCPTSPPQAPVPSSSSNFFNNNTSSHSIPSRRLPFPPPRNHFRPDNSSHSRAYMPRFSHNSRNQN